MEEAISATSYEVSKESWADHKKTGCSLRPLGASHLMDFWASQFTGIKNEMKGGCEGGARPQEEGWQALRLGKERLPRQKVGASAVEAEKTWS